MNSEKRWRSDANRKLVLKALSEFKDIVVLDTETTGFDSRKDRIIEFSATKYCLEDTNLRIIDKIHDYIKPPFDISEEITLLTGITNEQLALYEDEETVFKRIKSFFTPSPPIIAAYNIPFDMRFLRALYERNSQETIVPIYQLDVLEMARDLIDPSAIPNHKLSTVSAYYGIDDEVNFHSASGDSHITAKLLEIFYKKYLLFEENRTPKKRIRPVVSSACYWSGYRGNSRIYVQTDIGSVYFDLRKKSWYGKDVDIDTIDMNWVENEALRLTCSDNLMQFATFSGRILAN